MSHGPSEIRVLFVCHGNICRSPIAEGVFRHLVDAQGLSGTIYIDSAGVSDYHAGEPPHRQSVRVCADYGIDIRSQRARHFTASDLRGWDYVIGMDQGNMRDMRALGRPGTATVMQLLLDFAAGSAVNVPDPYWGGPDGFDDVYKLILGGCEGLLHDILTKHPALRNRAS